MIISAYHDVWALQVKMTDIAVMQRLHRETNARTDEPRLIHVLILRIIHQIPKWCFQATSAHQLGARANCPPRAKQSWIFRTRGRCSAPKNERTREWQLRRRSSPPPTAPATTRIFYGVRRSIHGWHKKATPGKETKMLSALWNVDLRNLDFVYLIFHWTALWPLLK